MSVASVRQHHIRLPTYPHVNIPVCLSTYWSTYQLVRNCNLSLRDVGDLKSRGVSQVEKGDTTLVKSNCETINHRASNPTSNTDQPRRVDWLVYFHRSHRFLSTFSPSPASPRSLAMKNTMRDQIMPKVSVTLPSTMSVGPIPTSLTVLVKYLRGGRWRERTTKQQKQVEPSDERQMTKTTGCIRKM